MSTYYGSIYSDVLNTSNWNYNWTAFYMNSGNDRVVTPNTGSGFSFYGQGGNDFFYGDSATDRAYGGNDNDTLLGDGGGDYLSGEYGDDTLSGNSGSDTLSGGYGRDHLYGGTGRDFLNGGYNADYFHISRGESNATLLQADSISDWNVHADFIDTSIRGTASNYRETSTTAGSIDAARAQAEGSSTLRVADHVFLYNRTKDIGYLLSDLDRNYSFETGVILYGAGSAPEMNYSDII